MEAARVAGNRALELIKGKLAEWRDVIKNGKFYLPTPNLLDTEEPLTRH